MQEVSHNILWALKQGGRDGIIIPVVDLCSIWSIRGRSYGGITQMEDTDVRTSVGTVGYEQVCRAIHEEVSLIQ